MPRARAATAIVEYVPEFGRPVRIAEFDRPMMGDDVETAQTIAYMDELSAADAGERSVVEATHHALEDAGLELTADPADIARAIFAWLKRTIRYVPTPGTSPLVDQTLITPAALLAMPEPIGDCPQFSMLAAAMFRVCCIPSYFVTIAAEPAEPGEYSHVYNTVEVSPGVFMPFDSSNGPAPGAEYAKPFKRRVWARITPDRCSAARNRKPMMRTSHTAPTGAGFRNRSLRGALGDLYSDAGVDPNYQGTQFGTVATTPGWNEIPFPGANVAPGNNSGGPSGGFLTTLINDAASIGTQLLKNQTQQRPYYVTSPSGQSVLYNPNSGAVSTPQTLGSAINPTYLVLGIAAIAALAMIGKK